MTIRSGTLADEDACVALWLAALELRDGFAPPASSSERAHAKFRRPIVRLGIVEGAPTAESAVDSAPPVIGFALTVRATDDPGTGVPATEGLATGHPATRHPATGHSATKHPATTADADASALLELIAVADGASGRGTGKALLDDAITAAAASGFRRLDLWVRRGNERAEGLYASRGFVATGGIEAHPLGGEPMVQYRRLLA